MNNAIIWYNNAKWRSCRCLQSPCPPPPPPPLPYVPYHLPFLMPPHPRTPQVCESHSMVALGRCIIDGSSEQEAQLDILDDVTQEVRRFALHRACATVARDLSRLMTASAKREGEARDKPTSDEQELAAIFVGREAQNRVNKRPFCFRKTSCGKY